MASRASSLKNSILISLLTAGLACGYHVSPALAAESLGYTSGTTPSSTYAASDYDTSGSAASDEENGVAAVSDNADDGVASVSSSVTTDGTNVSATSGSGATGTNSTAYGGSAGDDATASASYATAVGYSAKATATYASVAGYNSSTSISYGTAIGAGITNSTSGTSFIFIGYGVTKTETGNCAAAIGYNSAAGQIGTALGAKAYAGVFCATAIGTGSYAGAGSSSASYAGQYSIALGSGSYSDSRYNGAYVTGQSSIAIGSAGESLSAATITTDYSVAVGTGASISAASSTAIGTSATIGSSASGSIAIGYGATVTAASGVAIGYNATVTAEDGIALGAGSVAATAAGALGKAFGTSELSESEADSYIWTSTGGAISVGDITYTDNTIADAVTGYTPSEDEDGNVTVTYNNVTYTDGEKTVTENADGTTTVTTTSIDYDEDAGTVTITQNTGTGSLTRQITGVAAGTNDTDLVNVAQLKQVLEIVQNVQEEAGALAEAAEASAVTAQEAANTAYSTISGYLTAIYTAEETFTEEDEAYNFDVLLDEEEATTVMAASGAYTSGTDEDGNTYVTINGTTYTAGPLVTYDSDSGAVAYATMTSITTNDDGSVTVTVRTGSNIISYADAIQALDKLVGAVQDVYETAYDYETETVATTDEKLVASLFTQDGTSEIISKTTSLSQAIAELDLALGGSIMLYDQNDGVTDYTSVTLQGDEYAKTTDTSGTAAYSGGTSVTNVAYADGSDGSELVNVDYLNDSVDANSEKYVGAKSSEEGGTFSAFDGSSNTVIKSGMTMAEAITALDYALGTGLVKYDYSADGAIDYDSVTLEGDSYTDEGGGTSLTNVAYADGSDGSELVNVDLLNDSVDAYDAGLEAEGLKVSEDGEAYAEITSSGVSAAAEDNTAALSAAGLELTGDSSSASVTSGSITLTASAGSSGAAKARSKVAAANTTSVSLDASAGTVTVAAGDDSVSVGATAVTGLETIGDVYAEDVDLAAAVSVATLTGIIGDTDELAEGIQNTDGTATTLVDAMNSMAEQLEETDAAAVIYSGSASVTDAVALKSTYDEDTLEGGTFVSNVAYAVAASDDEDYDGSAAVNVDLLNDSLDDYNEQLKTEGLTVTSEDGLQEAGITSQGVKAYTYDEEGEAESGASVVSGSIELAAESAVSADAAAGVITVGAEDEAVTVTSVSISGLAAIEDIYADGVDATAAVSVGTLLNLIGTTSDLNEDLKNTVTADDGTVSTTATTLVDAVNNLYAQVAALQAESTLYDTYTDEDGEVQTDYASLTLGNGEEGTEYDEDTLEGGVSLTNVAYADGTDGSALVNVDYLKDALAAYNTQLTTSGFTVSGSSSDSYASLASGGVSVSSGTADAEETSVLTSAGLSVSAPVSGEETASAEVASGSVTVASGDAAVTVEASGISGLAAFSTEAYVAAATAEEADSETLSSAISVETLSNVIGDLQYVDEDAVASGEVTAYVTNGVDVTTAIGELNYQLNNLIVDDMTVSGDEDSGVDAGTITVTDGSSTGDSTSTTENEDGSTTTTTTTTNEDGSTTTTETTTSADGTETTTTETTTSADGTETTTTTTTTTTDEDGNTETATTTTTTTTTDNGDGTTTTETTTTTTDEDGNTTTTTTTTTTDGDGNSTTTTTTTDADGNETTTTTTTTTDTTTTENDDGSTTTTTTTTTTDEDGNVVDETTTETTTRTTENDDGSTTTTTTTTTTDGDGNTTTETTETTTTTTDNGDGTTTTETTTTTTTTDADGNEETTSTTTTTTTNDDGSSTTESTTTNPDGSGSTTKTETDTDGNSTSTTTDYDSDGNVTGTTVTTTTTDEDGTTTTTTTTYDADGNVTGTTTTTTDADGNTTSESVRSAVATESASHHDSDSYGVDTTTTEIDTATATDADGNVTVETTTTTTVASSEITGSTMDLSKDVTVTVYDGKGNVLSTETVSYDYMATAEEIRLSVDYGDGAEEYTSLKASGVTVYSAKDGVVASAQLASSALALAAEDESEARSAALAGGALALGYEDKATGASGAVKLDASGGVTVEATDENGASHTSSMTSSSLTIDGRTYITEEGIDANSQRITNVAEGTSYTDAATVGQLKRMDASLARRIRKVGAGAAALASLHPLDYDEDDKLNLAFGLGYYRGEKAGALGLFYQANDRIAGNLATTVGNDQNMVNFGVNFALDRVVGHSGQSRAALDRAVGGLLTENRQLASEAAMAAAEQVELEETNRLLSLRAAELEETVRKLTLIVSELASGGTP